MRGVEDFGVCFLHPLVVNRRLISRGVSLGLVRNHYFWRERKGLTNGAPSFRYWDLRLLAFLAKCPWCRTGGSGGTGSFANGSARAKNIGRFMGGTELALELLRKRLLHFAAS